MIEYKPIKELRLTNGETIDISEWELSKKVETEYLVIFRMEQISPLIKEDWNGNDRFIPPVSIIVGRYPTEEDALFEMDRRFRSLIRYAPGVKDKTTDTDIRSSKRKAEIEFEDYDGDYVDPNEWHKIHKKALLQFSLWIEEISNNKIVKGDD